MRLKRFSIILSATLIVGVAFGVLGLSFLHYNGHQSCPSLAVSGEGCPGGNNILLSVAHHLSGLKNLTQSLVATGLSLALFLILPLWFFFFILPKCLYQQAYFTCSEIISGQDRKVLRWLSLRGNSEPHEPHWALCTS